VVVPPLNAVFKPPLPFRKMSPKDFSQTTPTIRDGWAEMSTARLHYLIHEADAQKTPLAYIPGSLGSAEDFRAEMQLLSPRTTIALSLRGVGKSSKPKEGYSYHHLLSDVEEVFQSAKLPPFCLMAFSLGVTLAIGYAARHSEQVKGLILLDYPAHFPNRSEAWLERSLPFAMSRGIEEHVVRAIQREAQDVDLWADLGQLQCPILVIKGGQSEALSAEDLKRYHSHPHVRVVLFEDAGHEVFKPDYQRFMETVQQFVTHLDDH
jgi:pimeloyl-ACP methyl ester carboxylesterase